MINRETFKLMVLCSLLLGLFCSGCGYSIKYGLNQRDIVTAETSRPLRVYVTQFIEKRPNEEREKSSRKEKGESDLGDYTYDKQFRGTVSEEISKMAAQHLSYSKVFAQVTFAPSVTEDNLDSQSETEVDAILTGEIEHFYGYYDSNIGRQLLYTVPLGVASGLLLNTTLSSGNTQYTVYWIGPGMVLGYYLESLHKRRIEYATQLSAKLISTSTKEVIWQDSFIIAEKMRGSMPGIGTKQRKFQITLKSLRDAVNQMVESIATSSLSVK